MNYNIHPLFVHFPIAFLLLYSLIKIIPFESWFPKVAWRQVRQVLLVAGVLGAFLASSTGEIAEYLVRPNEKLVEMHAFFASASTWIFGILLAGELISLFKSFMIKNFRDALIVKFLLWIEKILTNRVLSILLVIAGMVAISLTGLLGGVIVYGITADPLAVFVLKFLGISL